jgi:hypothetical protein
VAHQRGVLVAQRSSIVALSGCGGSVGFRQLGDIRLRPQKVRFESLERGKET